MISTEALLLVGLALVLLWLVSVAIEDVSIIDVFWGPGFALIAWTCAYSREFELDAGQWLLVALVSIWGLRLGAYLAWRNYLSRRNYLNRRSRGRWVGDGPRPKEDRRYRAMRARVGPRFWWLSLVSVFGLQGVVMVVVSLPVQAVLLAGGGPWFGLVALVSVGVWGLGLCFEVVGDAQLARFLANPQNAGAVMDRGLWAWTRHPNYFGDFAIWWGHFGLAWTLGAPLWTVVGPLLMSHLLMQVSGVPMLEGSIAQRRPGYADYVRRTSAFFPRPPRSS